MQFDELQLECPLEKDVCLVRGLSFLSWSLLARNSLFPGSDKMTAVPGRNQSTTV